MVSEPLVAFENETKSTLKTRITNTTITLRNWLAGVFMIACCLVAS
jgi:hypothetical protein